MQVGVTTQAPTAAKDLQENTEGMQRLLKALTGRNIAAYPSPPGASEDDLGHLALLFCRRDTGDLVQRLQFATADAGLAVRLMPSVILQDEQ